MLQNENRLRKVRDFSLALKYGSWQRGRFLDLKYVQLAKVKDYFPKKEDPKEFEKQLKLAIVAGLKVSKKAVLRNRAKRQVREVVRILIKDKKLKDGFYIMLIAKKEIIGKNFADIKQETELLIKRSGLFRQS